MSHSSLSPTILAQQISSTPPSSNIPSIVGAGFRRWAPSLLACAAAPVAAAILSFFISSPAMANICIRMDALSSNGKQCDLRGKGITSLNPGSFAGLPRLASINLKGNKIRTLPEGVFSGLKNLRTIDLGGNNLVNLPATTFNGLEKLENIYLIQNNLVSLPAAIFEGLGNLRVISLWDNNLTSLPDEIFNGLESLEEISLSSNNLFSLSETTFNGLENLDEIRIAHNDLQSLPRNIFKDLYVSNLSLYGNDLVCLPILPSSVSTLNLTATESEEDSQPYQRVSGESGYYKNKLNTHGLQLCQ